MSLFGLFSPRQRPPHIRAAEGRDAESLAGIHAASFHRGWGLDEFERLLSDRAVRGHVLCVGPKTPPLGFILSHVVVPEAEILSLAVMPSARKKGLGALLLDHHLRRLVCEGVNISHLEVEEGNLAALRLYRTLGYVESGRRKGYYAGGMDALVMRRAL
ncbi:GNAT family N-acetyltransferase [Xanthobacter sp. DSM 24535]|uniref:GNAT family N-acetyltransferase n=1 Tax=Roseixanthobacter psychrophilus TaxID=3119917 RepID=UPI0037281D02